MDSLVVAQDREAESEAFRLFRQQLWQDGNSVMGDGFVEHCVLQYPFIMKNGVVEPELLGMRGSEFKRKTQEAPNEIPAEIFSRILEIPEFVFTIDDLAVAIMIDDYDQHNNEVAFGNSRVIDRCLHYVGVVPLRYAAGSVRADASVAVSDALELLAKLHERSAAFVDTPEQHIHVRVLDTGDLGG